MKSTFKEILRSFYRDYDHTLAQLCTKLDASELVQKPQKDVGKETSIVRTA